MVLKLRIDFPHGSDKIESSFSLRSVRDLNSLIRDSELHFGLPIDFLGPKGLGLVIRT